MQTSDEGMFEVVIGALEDCQVWCEEATAAEMRENI